MTLAWKEPALGDLRIAAAERGRPTSSRRCSEDFLALPEVARLRRTRATRRSRTPAARRPLRARASRNGKADRPDRDPRRSTPTTSSSQGTDTAALQRGPGHYPETGLPGQGTTIGIAGHRTTYGAPFNQIDKLEPGDAITLEMPYGTFTYEVTDDADRRAEPDRDRRRRRPRAARPDRLPSRSTAPPSATRCSPT